MHTITIQHLTASEAIDLHHSLQAAGLVINQDYTWAYYPAKSDNFSMYDSSRTEFCFAQDQMATFFRLRWGPDHT